MAVDRVDPSGIPDFTGNLPQLEHDAAALKKDASHVRSGGADVHSGFQGLRAFYDAPDAEQLFATTKPVQAKADDFAGDLEKVASALDTYASEVRPLVAKLKRLKRQAHDFVQNEVEGDDEWQYDEDKVNKNNDLIRDISTTVAQFWAAERTCANKITGLVGGTHWVADNGHGGQNAYGASVEDMKKSGKTPWGKAVEEKHHWYDAGHWIKSFVWDGFIVEGVWGTLKGLGGLVGLEGWDTFKNSWKGLAQLGTGLGLLTNPLTAPLALGANQLIPGAKNSWVGQSLNTTKQVGKSLVAWDEWSKNPGKAAGAATFNVLTAVVTDGGGAAVKAGGAAGKAAEVAAVAGRVGRVVDPTTHVVRAAGAAAKFARIDVAAGAALRATKVTDAMSHLKGVLGGRHAPTVPHVGDVHVPDAASVPDSPAHVPGAGAPDHAPDSGRLHVPDEHSVKLDDNGYLTHDGHYVNADGTPKAGSAPRHELSAHDRSTLDHSAGDHEPHATGPGAREPVGVGARGANDAAHAGGGGHVPGSRLHDVHPGSGGGHVAGGGSNHPPASGAYRDAVEHGEGGTTHDSTGPASHESEGGRGADGPGHHALGDHDGIGPEGDSSEAAHHADDGNTGGDHDSHMAEDQPGAGWGEGHGDGGDHAHDAAENPHGGEQRPALPPGRTDLTLRELRNLRHPRTRWQSAEDYARQLYGAGEERHYPVEPNDHPDHPVTTPGGRKVDAPVDLPNGKTLAVEVKMYQEYRTVHLPDGTSESSKVEVPLSTHIREQINKDIALRAQDAGYDPRWVFLHAPPSVQLREYLEQAKIIYVEYGPAPRPD